MYIKHNTQYSISEPVLSKQKVLIGFFYLYRGENQKLFFLQSYQFGKLSIWKKYIFNIELQTKMWIKLYIPIFQERGLILKRFGSNFKNWNENGKKKRKREKKRKWEENKKFDASKVNCVWEVNVIIFNHVFSFFELLKMCLFQKTSWNPNYPAKTSRLFHFSQTGLSDEFMHVFFTWKNTCIRPVFNHGPKLDAKSREKNMIFWDHFKDWSKTGRNTTCKTRDQSFLKVIGSFLKVTGSFLK